MSSRFSAYHNFFAAQVSIFRKNPTFKRKLTKTTQEELKSFTKLTKKSFACEEDARVALNEFEKSGSSEKSIPEQQKSYDMQKIETTCPLQLHITNSGSEVLTITSELKEAKVFQPLS